ncbi:MAG: cellulose biosynthesis cyclic di-GMP-binding regulatory protein BcsB [Pararhodobacter sp.]
MTRAWLISALIACGGLTAPGALARGGDPGAYQQLAQLIPQLDVPSAPRWAEAAPQPTDTVLPDGARFGARSFEQPEQAPRSNCITNLRSIEPGSRACRPVTLTGEADQRRLTLYLAEPADQTLRIRHRSGIDVLPDQSGIDVVVNGTVVDTIRPGNFVGFDTDTVTVPADALLAGVNRIDLRARHFHRIFCSPETTFALWTEIDLANSDARPQTPPVSDAGGAGFAAALAALAARDAPLVVTHPDGITESQSMAAVTPVLQQAMQRIGGAPPPIALRSPWDLPPPGPEPTARIALVVADEAAQLRFATGGDGATVLVMPVAADGSNTLAGQAASMVQGEGTPAPASADLSALPQLTPGTPQPLSALGYGDIAAAGQLQQRHIDFALPANWLVLTSQRARLLLDHAIAADLPEGSQMSIIVNGNFVRLLPLDRRTGAIEPRLPVTFEARYLRPGPNRITFDTVAPSPLPDLPCAPRAGANAEIFATSVIDVPASPAMYRPDLRRALGDLGWDRITLGARAQARLQPAELLQLRLALASGARGAGTADLTIIHPEEIAERQFPADVRRAIQRALLPAVTGAAPEFVISDTAQPADAAELLWQAPMHTWQRFTDWFRQFWQSDDEALLAWLQNRQAVALLMQPDGEAPESLLLVKAPTTALRTVALSLMHAPTRLDGPTGQVALLDGSGQWQVWHARQIPLRLEGQLTMASLRPALGNYASGAPTVFVGVFLSLILLSCLAMLALVILTREKDR